MHHPLSHWNHRPADEGEGAAERGPGRRTPQGHGTPLFLTARVRLGEGGEAKAFKVGGGLAQPLGFESFLAFGGVVFALRLYRRVTTDGGHKIGVIADNTTKP